jgi:hypothetical protein
MRYFLAAVLSLGLLFGDAFAGRPGGSSSSGRSSGGSSGRSSYSSGGSSGSSKSSYSSGRSTYSSGSSSSSSSSSSSKPSTTTNSKSSYSSGRSTYSSGPAITTAPKPSVPSNYHPGTSYSSGSRTYTAVSSSAGTKPKGGSFDGNAAAAQKRVESKAAYIKGPEPRPSYTTPTGRTVNINPSSSSVQQIHNMDHNVYITRETRIHTFYSSYPYYSDYGRYPVVVYNDPYSNFFWYWLLDQSVERRAMWAYNHRADIDDARYQALLAKDANLAARIRQLEAEKHAVDPAYVPPGLDQPDLMYTDDYVDSIVNPHTVVTHPGWFGKILWWFFMIVIGILVVWFLIYLLFQKRWSFR